MSRVGSGPGSGPGQAHSRAFAVPPALQPVLRAYVLGYVSAVGPRLLTVAVQHATTKLKRPPQPSSSSSSPSLPSSSSAGDEPATFAADAKHILRSGFDPRRFPTFCAVLVAGTSLLHKPLDKVIEKLGAKLSRTSRLRFLAGWFGMKLLHGKGTAPRRHSTALRTKQQEEARCRQMAGRTMDLTLFAVTRAADVIVGELWSQRRTRRQALNRWTKAEEIIEYLADPLVFVTSCALIMWSWVYQPDKLPRGYQKWITSAAQVDLRLIEALRRFHSGTLLYGRDTGQAALIGDMCADYGLPRAWGDPAVHTPLPCEIVHMGSGPSCEYHALSRFVRSWRWSMYTYLPLALILQLRKSRARAGNSSSSRHVVFAAAALRSASRSSAFLAMYITLFYYGVCLARSRLGPRLVSEPDSHAARQLLDGHAAVTAGCVLCGWSVLLEQPARRKDMGLFVAPRALATLLPRQYPRDRRWRETLAFSLAAAVVFTCALEKPRRVRGFFGALLGYVVRE